MTKNIGHDTSLELIYEVRHRGEPGTGLRSYAETVTVTVASGDPGGDRNEFREAMRAFLEDWFEGARVYTADELKIAAPTIADLNPETGLEEK